MLGHRLGKAGGRGAGRSPAGSGDAATARPRARAGAPRRTSCGPGPAQGGGQGSGPLWARPPPSLISGLSGAEGTFDASLFSPGRRRALALAAVLPPGLGVLEAGRCALLPKMRHRRGPTLPRDTEPSSLS